MAMPEAVEMYHHYSSEGAFHADRPAWEREGWSATAVQPHEVGTVGYAGSSPGTRATPSST
jgi:hypothetical protein